jgi:hypothetical protein
MISINYIAQGNLEETKASVKSLIKAVNMLRVPVQAIFVCGAELAVCEFILDAKIMSYCRPMKKMTYVQASPEESTAELIQRSLDIMPKLPTYEDITHTIIIDRTNIIPQGSLMILVNKLSDQLKTDKPYAHYLFKDKPKKRGDL